MTTTVFWACGESYRGSGRPSRTWVEATDENGDRPDAEDENGDRPYPFNGMGADVLFGPFRSEDEAHAYCSDSVGTTEGGWEYWADQELWTIGSDGFARRTGTVVEEH